jgi:hypothetical protein
MKKIIAVLAIVSSTSSAFALSRAAVVEALRVTKIDSITSITEDQESGQPRCPCELVKIVGLDANGKPTSKTVTVEYIDDGLVKALPQ